MSNPFFNNTRLFIPGTTADANEVNNQFNDVALGFDGVDLLKFDKSGGTITGNVTVNGTSLFQSAVSMAAALAVSGAVTLNGVGNKITVSGVGSTYSISPATAGSLNNVVIGGVTPLAGSFTTLSASGALTANGGLSTTTLTTSGTVTLNGGTANGVAYLNGSKVLTTGSALTFDGTNLGLGTATPADLNGGASRGLVVNGSSSAEIDLATAGLRRGYFYADSSTAEIGTVTGGIPLRFSIGLAEQMRLTSTGLRIGTTVDNTGSRLFATNSITTDFFGTIALRFNSVGEINSYYKGITGTSLQDGVARGLHIFNFDQDSNRGISFYPNSRPGLTNAPSMVLDPAGNLGLGVTPSAWSANFKAFEIGAFGKSLLAAPLADSVYLSNNAYVRADGNFAYGRSAQAVSMYGQLANSHIWYNAPSGTAGAPITFTQAMTLTQGGNLLVGATVDGFRVNITGTSGAVGTPSNYVFVTDGRAGGSVTDGGRIYFGRGGASTLSDAAGFIGSFTASSVAALAGGLVFGTNQSDIAGSTPTERARITSAGYSRFDPTGQYINQVGISDRNALFHTFHSPEAFNVVARANSTVTNNFYSALQGGATGFHFTGETAATIVYQVLANGNVQNTNNSYGAISDAKLKENVTDATPKLAQLNRLRVVNYNLIGDDLKQIGLIAQEVEQVFPALVESTPDIDPETKEPTGTVTKSVKYSVLVPMLLKAVQELTAKVAALEAA